MRAENGVDDFSGYDATNEGQARQDYAVYRRRWRRAVEHAVGEPNAALRKDGLRIAFELFRAAEQIGDAYFFDNDETFIDADLCREAVTYPVPVLTPLRHTHQIRMISPEYRERLEVFLSERYPELSEGYNEIAASLTANPVVRQLDNVFR